MNEEEDLIRISNAEMMGRVAERERIIKLLESYFKPEEAKAIYPADYEQYLDIIALIKGEQNG